MSFASDEQDDKLIRVHLTDAVEKFMAVPERLEEELAPAIKKMSRLAKSPIAIKIKTGGLNKVPSKTLREEVDAFLRYLDEFPPRYLIRIDSVIDILREEELTKEELGDYYVNAITRVRQHLLQEVRDKYAVAIRVILEYQKTNEQGDRPNDYREEWVAPRARHTGSMSLSLLPGPVLDRLSIGKDRATLEELSLEEIQTVAHTLALSISLGDKNN